MDFSYTALEQLQRQHPAWRLLKSSHAPLVVGFLHRAFIEQNNRMLAESALAERLEDELYRLRQTLGETTFPRRAIEYLDDWTLPERAWLRKFYREDSDEPYFDLTPATEKAIAWIASLAERSFVGTESRLLTVFDLLRQINSGAESNPSERLEDLKQRKREIEREIERAEHGEIQLLDATAIKDRFQQLVQVSRELLADFREVEHNFRKLERRFRETVARGKRTKKEVLDVSLGRHDEIAESDQGRSFGAFWDFLMAEGRTDEFEELLDRILALPAIQEMKPDERTREMHYEWAEAGEHAQRTVRQLSNQLRRFLDDRAQMENRRIMELLQSVERSALALRDSPPGAKDPVAEIESTRAEINLPMERPLYAVPKTPVMRPVVLESGHEEVDISRLYSQATIDPSELSKHVNGLLETRTQVTLGEVCKLRPLKQGLAELLAYLQLAAETFDSAIDLDNPETVTWLGTGRRGEAVLRSARVPRVIFVR